MLIKMLLITVITAAMFAALWKTLLGLTVPVACLWVYGWFTGFSVLSVKSLLIFTAIHLLFQGAGWWLSGRYREASLAYTGSGIIGMSTGLLASMFFGGLLGFFMWLGFIGHLIARPTHIGIKPIARSFAGGTLKFLYGVAMAGVLAVMLL